MSKYLFGLHLDGCVAPSFWQGIGKSVCGPSSLLSALESILGLPPTETNQLERTIAYREAIAETWDKSHFYADSFTHDPLATAKLLLSLRDELVEAGWSSTLNHDGATERLQTMAIIEASFQGADGASYCSAYRITAILNEVKLQPHPIVTELIVTDPKETLPQCWVQLFDALDAKYENPAPSNAIAPTNSQLAQLQEGICGEDVTSQPQDESVRIITAATSEAAAIALANELSTLQLSETTLIADGKEQARLNQQIYQLDLPRPPASDETGAAIIQLPTLFLRSCFAPFDPQAYLEYLLHPISPIPKGLRNSLAGEINNTPGYGTHWTETLEKFIKRATERNDAQPDTETNLRDAYQQWVQPASVDPNNMTGPEFGDRLSPLSQWLNKRAKAKTISNSDDADQWFAASRSLQSLIHLLSNEGELTRIELERLITQWMTNAAPTVKFPGEVGSATLVATPSQLLEPREHIIWWRPTPTATHRCPWSPEELEWFKLSNISILDETHQALALEQAAIRAALMAKKSLTIYHVSQSEGTTTAHAGILTRVTAICGEHIIEPARANIPMKDTPLRLLPSKRRWWNFMQLGLFPPRDTESFSSVSKVIDTPFMWVLNYHARLYPGKIFSCRVKDNPLRSGSILHDLAEKLFEPSSGIDWNTIQETELHAQVETALSELFISNAAHYLIHGNEAARAKLTHNAKQTFWQLTRILHKAEIVEIIMEKSIEPITFIGGEIAGRIDLIARRADGATVVIDLKLGGKTNRTKELQENRHLQLAVYGQLMLKSEESDVATAFYILSNGGALLTRNEAFFSDIRAISPKKDTPHGDWRDCWDEFEDVYRWRRDQLDRGKVEVPVENTGPNVDPQEAPPLSRWEPPKDACKYSDFDALTGWNLND